MVASSQCYTLTVLIAAHRLMAFLPEAGGTATPQTTQAAPIRTTIYQARRPHVLKSYVPAPVHVRQSTSVAVLGRTFGAVLPCFFAIA